MYRFPPLSSPPGKKSEKNQKKKTPSKKIDNAALRTPKLSIFQEKVNDFFSNLTPELAIFSSPSKLLDEFEKHIVNNAREIAPKEKKERLDWFTEDENNLINLIESRNIAYKNFMKTPNDENQQKLKESRHTLLKSKRKTKRQWQLEYTERCRKQDFRINPKEAWSMVFKIMEEYQNHHKVCMPRNFKNKLGIEAKNDENNAKILNTHFYSLFNSNVLVDETVLERIPQRKVATHLDETPSEKEVKSAIDSMAYDKAPGKSGLSTDMIKNLPE
jgi:hypothetical protein